MRGKAVGQSQVDKILQLRMQGKPVNDIAKTLGLEKGAVYRALRKNGIGRNGGASPKRADGVNARTQTKLDELVQIASPRAKAAERTETKQTELERLRQIVERLAARYPSILVKVL